MKKYLLLLLLTTFSTKAQVVNIPDANFKAKLLEASPSNDIAKNFSDQNIKIDLNNDGEIQESEALLVSKLNVNNASIASLVGINSFVNLKELRANDNSLSSLNLNGLFDFNYLEIRNNLIVSQNDLYINTSANGPFFLLISNNLLSSFDLDLFLSDNLFANIFNFIFSLSDNPIVSLNATIESYPFLSIGMIIRNTLLETFESNVSYISSFIIENNTLLETINLNHTSANTSYKSFSININQNQSLETVNLQSDNIFNNGVIAFSDNISLNNLNIEDLISNGQLYISNSPLANLNIENCRFYDKVEIQNVECELIDLSKVQFDQFVITDNLMLQFLNLKNGSNNSLVIDYLGFLPQLEYVCVDDSHVEWYQNLFASSHPNVNFNSYCSFVPGGTFYTLQGQSKLDIDSNGCDENDIDFPNMKFAIANNYILGSIISNSNGNYTMPLQSGTNTITPVLENPTYFNVIPSSFTITFPEESGPFTQNFCILPNGTHQDVEVIIIPLNVAVPGFDASYKLVYKNKGNTTISGSVSLSFMANVLGLVSSNPVQNSVEANILNWNYSNLQPMETREILITFNLNSPQEIPALNDGDVLNFTAIIDPISGDELTTDNTSTLNQEVVNSQDPNDKTCLQGSVVSTELIGQYVHYVIRFENTGTFVVNNVVVKDQIDWLKFDLSSLIVLSASHQQWTRIKDSKVEFIFENIQLPFPPSEERHGYIAFKIKLKNNLSVGDTFSNYASIYFDYNFPIITEAATTTIVTLNNQDFEFSNYMKLYPNPSHSILTLESQSKINLKSIEIYNSLGQLLLAIPNENNILNIDISHLHTGTYFVKVHSDKGVGVSQFVKQ